MVNIKHQTVRCDVETTDGISTYTAYNIDYLETGWCRGCLAVIQWSLTSPMASSALQH